MSELIRISMRDQIYGIIKNRIISQEYGLGDPINIVTLSKELSISNTPIREAMSMLCAEGLVISTVNSKFRVVELDEQMMGELNETVLILLSGAYMDCCRRGRTSELSELLENAYARQVEASHEPNQITYIRSAIAFDRCFVAVCGNARLNSVFDSLSDLLFLSVRYSYAHSRMGQAENMAQHRALADAVKANRQDNVQSLLVQHYNKHYQNDQ